MQEVQRALITPDEVMRLPTVQKDAHGQIPEPGYLLIFMADQAPIYGRQILYFRNPAFQQRAQVAAPATNDRLDTEAA